VVVLAEIGRRPVVVLSRDAAIPRLRRALVAPCTTTIRTLASEVVLEPGEDPIPLRSAVNLDSVESVSVGAHVGRLGRFADDRMREVCGALAVAVDCERSNRQLVAGARPPAPRRAASPAPSPSASDSGE
jgi:mRNA interferase MazF